jgi:hypothetical protein
MTNLSIVLLRMFIKFLILLILNQLTADQTIVENKFNDSYYYESLTGNSFLNNMVADKSFLVFNNRPQLGDLKGRQVFSTL